MCASEQHFLRAGRNVIELSRQHCGSYADLDFAKPFVRLTVHFAAGEEQQDMDLALRSIADAAIDIRPWLGERIGLNAVARAVAEMSGPRAPIRSPVDPRRL